MTGNTSKEMLKEILNKVEPNQCIGDVIVEEKIPIHELGNFSGSVQEVVINAKIENQNKSFHWLVKEPLEEKGFKTMSKALHMDEKEIKVYNELIPAFNKIIKDRNANISLDFCQPIYSRLNQEGSVIVFENIKKQGFIEANTSNGLNIEYTKLVMESVAKFHAVSYVYLKNYPGGLKEGLENNKDLLTDYFHHNRIEFQEMDNKTVRRLENLYHKHDMFDHMKELFKYSPKEFNVMCFGDLWFNHMLFYHETKDDKIVPTKVRIMDLSITRYANPGTDLSFFLYLLTNAETLKKKLDQILGFYHNTLMDCLNQLGENVSYPFEIFRMDFLKSSIIGTTSKARYGEIFN